ncbi:MAG: TonB-linked SusC/RagA family outer membrane protein [Cyclobacteriaceae bacterium]|jgi:TonB-linked SusC/RagA family outer membrane protein
MNVLSKDPVKMKTTRYFYRFGVSLILIALSFYSYAQSYQISGQVIDGEGETLPGVTVLVIGTSTGTITDLEGNYIVKAEPDASLQYSFVGFKPQTIAVNGRSKIDLTLEVDIIAMDEVVVIGYGTVDKKDLTGSVSVLGEGDLELHPVVRMEAALQSKVPGVVVNQNSGNPGSALKVRIRGTNSFGGGNDPLYVIDGFFGADIQSLNPDDIKSISILKDASATALYGSQGANGVILITTKTGNKNTPASIDVKYQHSISQLRDRWDLMEGWEYMSTINDRLRAGGTQEQNLPFSRKDILESESQGGTDWQDEIFQTGTQDLIQLSIKKGGLYLSGAAQINRGILKNTEYDRYNFRLTYSEKIFEPVKLFFTISDALERRYNADFNTNNIDIIRSAVTWPTNLPPIDPTTDDYYRNQAYGPLSANPLFSINERNGESYRNNLRTNGSLEFRLAPSLKFTSMGGIGLVGVSSTSFNRVSPNEVINNPLASSYSNNNRMTLSWQTTQQLNYKKSIGKHNLDITGVYEARSSNEREFRANGSQLTTTALGYYSAPVASFQTNGVDKENTEIWSYFGRANYGFNDKFLATLNVRHDESSRLGQGFEGATFYGGALAYRLSEETFLESISWLDELKLRMSLGQVGSQAVGFLETIETVGYNNGYSYDGISFIRGATLPGPKNPQLTWEITNQFDVGVDVRVLNDRFSLTVDYFYKKTTGLIFNQIVPDYLGGGSIKVNAGQMENKGFEFAASGYIVDNKDFSIETSANFSFVKNRLLDIIGDSDFIKSGKNPASDPDLQDNTHRNFVGQPLGLLWGFVFDGVYSTDQAEEAALYNRSPGDPIYRDINQDSIINNSDMTVIGNPNPDYTWGFTSNIRYKDFTLNMVWGGVHGVDVLNSVKYSTYGGARDATNVDRLDRWTPENQNTNVPGFTTTSVLQRQSSQWIEDGSYIKLRNVTLKYDVPVNKADWIKGVKSLSVYVTLQNALVFTDYTGYDPESLSNTGDRAGGFDEGGYPIPRVLLTGINFGF